MAGSPAGEPLWSGHSALTALVALAALAEQAVGTTAVWVLRPGEVGNTFGCGDADEFPREKRPLAARPVSAPTTPRGTSANRSAMPPTCVASDLMGFPGLDVGGGDPGSRFAPASVPCDRFMSESPLTTNSLGSLGPGVFDLRAFTRSRSGSTRRGAATYMCSTWVRRNETTSDGLNCRMGDVSYSIRRRRLAMFRPPGYEGLHARQAALELTMPVLVVPGQHLIPEECDSALCARPRPAAGSHTQSSLTVYFTFRIGA